MSFTGLFKSIDGNGIHANIVKTSQSTKVSQNIGRSNVITLACCMKFTINMTEDFNLKALEIIERLMDND